MAGADVGLTILINPNYVFYQPGLGLNNYFGVKVGVLLTRHFNFFLISCSSRFIDKEHLPRVSNTIGQVKNFRFLG